MDAQKEIMSILKISKIYQILQKNPQNFEFYNLN